MPYINRSSCVHAFWLFDLEETLHHDAFCRYPIFNSSSSFDSLLLVICWNSHDGCCSGDTLANTWNRDTGGEADVRGWFNQVLSRRFHDDYFPLLYWMAGTPTGTDIYQVWTLLERRCLLHGEIVMHSRSVFSFSISWSASTFPSDFSISWKWCQARHSRSIHDIFSETICNPGRQPSHTIDMCLRRQPPDLGRLTFSRRLPI